MDIIAFVCLLALYWFKWRDYLLPYQIQKKSKSSNYNETFPKLSIVVVCNHQCQQVEALIPYLLKQDYPDFEIIFVDESPTDETKSMIEHYQIRNKKIRYTFVPETATDICRRKLAITLGIRASRSEWCLITTASGCPTSFKWLKTIGACTNNQTDIVIGYSNYVDNGECYSKRAIYERLQQQIIFYRAVDKGAIGGDELNFCIRKSAFLQHKGYANNLQIAFGESHLLIQTLAKAGNTKIAILPEGVIKEELPLEAVLKNLRMYHRIILNFSTRRTKLFLWREGFATTLFYAYIANLCIYLFMRIGMCDASAVTLATLISLDSIMLMLTLAWLFLPVAFLRKSTKSLQERNFGGYVLAYTFLQPFYNFYNKCQCYRIDDAFTRK